MLHHPGYLRAKDQRDVIQNLHHGIGPFLINVYFAK